jgi:hypothetical protein
MKTRRIIGIAATITIMLLSLASLSFAQHLMDDEVWFKMKMSVKGHDIVLPSSPYVPLSDSGTVYVRVWPTATAYQHSWEMRSQNQPGSWSIIDNGTQYIFGSGDGLIFGWAPQGLRMSSVNGLDFSINGIMKIQREGLATKKAKFTSTGCAVNGLTAYGYFFGGCKVTGSTVSADKLPFEYP